MFREENYMVKKVQAITKEGKIVLCDKYQLDKYCKDHVAHKRDSDSQIYFNCLAAEVEKSFINL